MNLYSLKDLPAFDATQVCRKSGISIVLAFVATAFFSVLSFIVGFNGGIAYGEVDVPVLIAHWMGAVAGFVALLMSFDMRKRFAPENWLVQVGDTALLLKFRSYLNRHFDPADSQVIRLERSDISGLGQVTEVVESPANPQGKKKSATLKYLEIRLSRSVECGKFNLRCVETIERIGDRTIRPVDSLEIAL